MADQMPSSIDPNNKPLPNEDTHDQQHTSTPIEESQEVCVDMISEAFDKVFPENVTIDFDNQESNTKLIIEESNEKAKSEIIKSYANNENERVNRQKYLLWAVVFLATIQIVFFNVVIAGVVYFSFRYGEQETINNTFDILKYYIGATVVELIGMIVYITSGTFSSSHVDVMKMLIQGAKK